MMSDAVLDALEQAAVPRLAVAQPRERRFLLARAPPRGRARTAFRWELVRPPRKAQKTRVQRVQGRPGDAARCMAVRREDDGGVQRADGQRVAEPGRAPTPPPRAG